MKRLLLTVFLVFFFVSQLVFTSCTKPTEDVTVTKELVGIWRFGTTTASVTVEGENFVDYAITNFGFTENEAQAMEDDILEENFQNPAGDIIFTNDKNFVLDLHSQAEEYGTWSVNADGNSLSLVLNNMEEVYQILELNAKTLILKFPTQQVEVDLNDDGTTETTVDINVEQNLKEVSNGGYGG